MSVSKRRKKASSNPTLKCKKIGGFTSSRLKSGLGIRPTIKHLKNTLKRRRKAMINNKIQEKNRKFGKLKNDKTNPFPCKQKSGIIVQGILY